MAFMLIVDVVVTSVLLMQSHTIDDLEVWKCITPDIILTEAQRLAFMLYKEHCELL